MAFSIDEQIYLSDRFTVSGGRARVDAIDLPFVNFSLKVRLNYLFRLLRLGSTIRMDLLYIKCCIFFFSSPELNKITIVSIRTLINSLLNLTSRRPSRLYSSSPFPFYTYSYTYFILLRTHMRARIYSIFNHPSHPSSLFQPSL